MLSRQCGTPVVSVRLPLISLDIIRDARCSEKAAALVAPAEPEERVMKPSPRNTWVVIVTALISSGTTLAGQYLASKASGNTIAAEATDMREISGSVMQSETNPQPLRSAEVYLLPATGKEHIQLTSDTGVFHFSDVPPETYWLVVRNVSSGAGGGGSGVVEAGEIPG